LRLSNPRIRACFCQFWPGCHVFMEEASREQTATGLGANGRVDSFHIIQQRFCK